MLRDAVQRLSVSYTHLQREARLLDAGNQAANLCATSKCMRPSLSFAFAPLFGVKMLQRCNALTFITNAAGANLSLIHICKKLQRYDAEQRRQLVAAVRNIDDFVALRFYGAIACFGNRQPVSYTHLDLYKRQP